MVDVQFDVFSAFAAVLHPLQEGVCRLRHCYQSRAHVHLLNFIFQNPRIMGSVLSKIK